MAYLTGTYIKRWRKHRQLSARELGIALGYRGREYIKKIELGYFPITAKFRARFERFKNQTQSREYREHKIESKFALPRRIKILAKPRRCDVCREWFIFPSTNQRTCTAASCRREHARRRAAALTPKRCGPECAKIARGKVRQ